MLGLSLLAGCNALTGIDAYGTAPGETPDQGTLDAPLDSEDAGKDAIADPDTSIVSDSGPDTMVDSIADTTDTNVPDAFDGCPKNPCGGCSALAGKPGDTCTCGGTLGCSGTDALTCSKALNACGGCATLKGTPGTACETCGGTWACSGTEAVACSKPTNECGGCTPSSFKKGDPCDACGSSYQCDLATKSLKCFNICPAGDVCCSSSGSCIPFGSPC